MAYKRREGREKEGRVRRTGCEDGGRVMVEEEAAVWWEESLAAGKEEKAGQGA
jgi:hypothetical protein